MQIQPQIISKITDAKSVLVIVSGQNGDSLSAGLALYGFLKKLEKETAILTYTPRVPELEFLPGFPEVRTALDVERSFVIDLSTLKAQIDELSYKKETDKLSIFIKPKKGQFSPEDVTFRNSSFPFDLLILIGVNSLEDLGEIYNQNTELFFETPMINIDFKSTNEAYAQFNVVDLSATSNSEIMFDLINQFEASLMDETMATQLLTGIIVETDNFKHVRTTPTTFLKASQLVSLGANQQQIILRFYKSKSLGLLKLWGRVLAGLKQDVETSLVYSTVSQTDFVRSTATAEDADKIIAEMVSQLGFAKLFLFLNEIDAATTVAYFYSALPIDAKAWFAQFNPKSIDAETIQFRLALPAVAAEKQLLDLIKDQMAKYKGNV